MVPGGIEAKHLHVQCVRKPRYRMPVQRVIGGERPPDGVLVQAALYVDVVGYVLIVIQVEEGMTRYGEVQRDGCSRQQKADNQVALVLGERTHMALNRGLVALFNSSEIIRTSLPPAEGR